MKYKVGDTVRVKSREWYKEMKNGSGVVRMPGEYDCFTSAMAVHCGVLAKVVAVKTYPYRYNKYYVLNIGVMFCWEDWMFADVVIENIKECAP
jgi:hypothetical protein